MAVIPTESDIYRLKIEDWHFIVPDFYVIVQNGRKFFVPKDWASIIFCEKGTNSGIVVSDKYLKWLPRSIKSVCIDTFMDGNG